MGTSDRQRARASSLITVGALAREAGVARSTLLYYDRLGLLAPVGRSHARYRLYGEAARKRLRAIRVYRGVGLGLADIRRLLDAPDRPAAVLTERLDRLNTEIAQLREQQRVIVRLLADRALLRRTRALDKRRWVEILAAAGLTEPQMAAWHAEFEARAPDAHQDFLESLGIAPREVTAIRRVARAGPPVRARSRADRR